jgi:hypothetical protein
MPDTYTFAAVASAVEVTNLLTNNKASKARVAAVGKENPDKQFNVWYVPSNHNHQWHFKEIQFDLNADTDTKAVTAEIDQSEFAAVTFFGQTNSFYVWWLK